MASALKSFVLLTLVAFMSVFVIWGYLRAKGEMAQIHQPLKHEFLTSAHAPDVVAMQALEDRGLKGSTLERFTQLANLNEGLVFWLDVVPDREGRLLVESRGFDVAPPLPEVLRVLVHHRLILNFHNYQPGMLEWVARDLAETKAFERALIQSPEDGFLKDLREAQPLWLFGSSQAQVTRMIMLSSIGLETQAPLKGDVFVMQGDPTTPPLAHEMSRLSDSIVAEVHRRGMKLYAGPVPLGQIDELVRRGVDGILTSEPEEYLSRPTVAVARERRTH